MSSYEKRIAGIESEVTEIRRLLTLLYKGQNKTLKELKNIMSQQDDLAALVAAENADLAAIGKDLSDVDTAIQAQAKAFADFAAAHPTLDLSGLQTAQAGLDAAASKLGGVAAAIGGIVTPPTPATA